ncbi:DUF5798 family protein [Halobaculum sp. EA56]|uniref:DUF5798 family protein n=1 Tax=Halobaculum sp. EA56 TaxID=3421648 RepID=UPI003EB7FEAE
MGLGSTAKKLQTVADLAEKLYAKVNEIRERVESMQEGVRNTEERVGTLERDLAEQRAVVEALAEAEGIDVDAVLEDADLPAADADGDGGTDAAGTETTAAEDTGDT